MCDLGRGRWGLTSLEEGCGKGAGLVGQGLDPYTALQTAAKLREDTPSFLCGGQRCRIKRFETASLWGFPRLAPKQLGTPASTSILPILS